MPEIRVRRGRPPIGQRVHVTLPAHTLRRIDLIASDAEMTRAEVIRELLVTALDDRAKHRVSA